MKKESVYSRERSLFNAWYNLRKGFELFYTQYKGDLNINPAEGSFLSRVYYQEGISQREIAQGLGVSEANIAKTFKKLESKKLVYKTVDRENNARRNLFLTEEGEKVIEKFMALLDDFDELLFSGLSKEQIEAMEEQANELTDNLLKVLSEDHL